MTIGRHPEPTGPENDPHHIAARWFARQRSGEMTHDARLELRLWLEEEPANTAAYAEVRRAWGGSGSVRSDPRVLAMREHWKSVDAAPAWFPGRAVAASIVAALLVVASIAGWQVWSGPKPLADAVYRTAVGERRTVELPDGSVVTLNTRTVLRTQRNGDRRLIFLEEGQAFFQVAKHPERPFVVTAAGRTITALGTAFDVRVDDDEFKVTLVEGKVRVESVVPAIQQRTPGSQAPAITNAPDVQATEMVAGSQLIAPANEDWRITRTNVETETSWTKGRLIFNRERLRDVVDELNRYSDRKIVLADADLADVPISGTFKPGDVSSFVAAMEEYRMARGGRVSQHTVELLPY
jgi:transmembrane sensor